MNDFWYFLRFLNLFPFGLAASLGFLASCNLSDDTLFTPVAVSDSHLDFTNEVFETDSLNLAYNYYFYNGAGVSVADFNNDSLPDIFLVGNHVPSRLYLNQGNLKFRDVSEAAGLLNDYWTSGATFVDINGDHLQDIFVCTVGKEEPNLLYINQGIGTDGVPLFKEKAAAYGLADPVISTHAAFLDYDRDNDLDLFVAVNSQLMNNRNEINREKHSATRDRFYRNNGDNTFTEVSDSVGIVNEGYSLGIAVNDINNDGWPDIYVANDFITNDLLYVNNRQGGFEERGADYLRHASHNGMGVDIADVNQDGLMDITVVDMLPKSNRRRKLMTTPLNYDLFEYRQKLGYIPQHVKNTLQINQGADADGNYHFSETGTLAGMYATDWSWAPLWADFDNSGTLDLFITNGYYKDLTDLDFSAGLKEDLKFGSEAYSYAYQMEALENLRPIKPANFFYRNSGGMVLEDASAAMGITEPSFSHGAAFADLDQDGDLELVVNNLGHPAFLYRNNTVREDTKGENHYLKVNLTGPGQNTNALGAQLSLWYDNARQVYYHAHVRGYLSSMSQTIHFGLGNTDLIDSLSIRWPNGTYQRYEHVAANQTLNITYQPLPEPYPEPAPLASIFSEVTDSLGLGYEQRENRFIDFKDNPLLLKMHSREGPALAVGDVNGDGADDLVVGGAAGQSARLFIQQSGKFEQQPILAEDAAYEDMGILLFDADRDGDSDLYVVSGGAEYPASSPRYEDRLYINEGGQFVRAPNLPAGTASGGAVRGADVDRDGDIDLFIGGKVSPGRYPESPTSRLLINEGGNFVDRTPPALRQPGMLSDALWTDFNNDGWPDLVAVGEWTEILFFINRAGTLEPYTEAAGLAGTTGWWNSLTAGDYDRDGDTDYVVGNFGLNSYLTASPEHPIRLYADDFNEDGVTDPILSYYSEDDDGQLREFPVHPRDALIDQVLGYKKRFRNYLSFAQAGFSEVLKPHDRKNTRVLEVNTLTSSLIENRGDGTFTVRPLPLACQVAPAYGMLTRDLDRDGNLDVIVTGNQYSAEPVFGNYDASEGTVMLGDGKGDFTVVPPPQSGLFLNDDQKSIATVYVDGKPIMVSGANSGPLRAHHYQALASEASVIALQPNDTFAEITWSDGRKTRQEFYYGSTYLSQAARKIELLNSMKAVVIYDSQGKSRRVK